MSHLFRKLYKQQARDMKLRVVLGDQLSLHLSSLRDVDAHQDRILMCEIRQETDYVEHHQKKIAFIFSAMRHFAESLRVEGLKVQYRKFDDPENSGSFIGEIKALMKAQSFSSVVITTPGEYRLWEEIKGWEQEIGIPVEIRSDDRFLCSIRDFRQWADGRKQLRMEHFYREMRRHHNILMDGNKPVGGKWNYDAENRKPADDSLKVPAPHKTEPDQITRDVLDLVDNEFSDHIGSLHPFHYAVDRQGALAVLDHFISHRLPHFGDHQDVMLEGEPWMYHSHISLYLNVGLLDPMECIRAAERAYYDGQAPLNAAEGFIRQILGWREYVRGIYWWQMPSYATENFLNASRELPPLFWGEATKMNCLSQVISETLENAYAHHIQRLMIVGNFALLAGLHPDGVNNWYLRVYADAFEWVEMPNVTGMILFADGGLLASKPYAAGGAYVSRMSNYCDNCAYKVSKKNGEGACPFNYLYWDFLIRNQDTLSDNPRLGMPYRNLARMDDDKIKMIKQDSNRFLKAMDNAEKI